MGKMSKLAGQTAIYGLGTIVPRLLNYLLLTPFYTRIFVTAEYGVFTELYAYVAFLAVLLTYGMETAYFRFVQEEDPEKVYQTSLLSLLLSSSLFLVLGLLFSNNLAGAIRYPGHPEYVRLFVLIIGIDAVLAIPFARLRQQNRALWFSGLKIINLGVNIGLNLFFYVLCPHLQETNPNSFWLFAYDPDLGVAYAFWANLATSLVTAILLLPELRLRLSLADRKLLLRMLSYSWPVLLIGLAGMINDVSDKIFLKFLIDDPGEAARQVGIYGANYKLAMLMTLFTQMFRFAADPFFFSQMNDSNRNQTYALATRFFVVAGLGLYLAVMLFLDLVRYFIGQDFHEGLGIVPVVMLANLFYGITYNLSFWYKIGGKTVYGAWIAGIGAFVTLLLNLLLIPKWGYVGAAWTTLGCYSVMMVVSYFWGQRHLPVDYGLPRIISYFLLAGLLVWLGRLGDGWANWLQWSYSLFLLTTFLALVLFVEREHLVVPLQRRFSGKRKV